VFLFGVLVVANSSWLVAEHPDRFVDLLKSQQKVRLETIRGTSTFDIEIVDGQIEGEDESWTHIVVAVKADYVVLRHGASESYLPFRSVRTISRQIATIRDHLQRRISVDIGRQALHAALADIFRKAGLNLDIDGNALKSDGFTRNMAVNVSVKDAPVSTVLAGVLKPYGGQLIFIKGENGLVLTTARWASKNGKKKLDLFVQPAEPKDKKKTSTQSRPTKRD
jgi:hypothetical protein